MKALVRGPLVRRAGRWLTATGAVGFGLAAYTYLTLPDVRALARTNPSSTAFMEIRAREARQDDRPVRRIHRWVPYSRISANLKRAVIVAEDGAFWQHEGVDYDEIRKSIETAFQQGGELRGASTITQQLAKNLYLSPSRNPLRKLQELIIARRLEATLPKARILEIYLNVVEWGNGIWGAEAAARTYFGVPASALSREQAALLAGALINPIVYSPAQPRGRLLRRQQIILSRMGGVRPPPAVPVTDAPSTVPAEELEPGPGSAPPTDVPAPTDEPPLPDAPAPEGPAVPIPADPLLPEPVPPSDVPPAP